jgi:hypothetical protein
MAVIDEAALVNWFTAHILAEEDTAKCKLIREAGLVFARVIVENTPASADQSAAIRQVRQAVWSANAAIACGGV